MARYWAKAKDLVVVKPCEMELHAGFPYPPEATLWNVVTQDKTRDAVKETDNSADGSETEEQKTWKLHEFDSSIDQPPRAAFASASSSLSLTHLGCVNCFERTLALMCAAMVF